MQRLISLFSTALHHSYISIGGLKTWRFDSRWQHIHKVSACSMVRERSCESGKFAKNIIVQSLQYLCMVKFYLNAWLGQIQFDSQRLSHENIRIMTVCEWILQLLQLPRSEVCPCSSSLLLLRIIIRIAASINTATVGQEIYHIKSYQPTITSPLQSSLIKW